MGAGNHVGDPSAVSNPAPLMLGTDQFHSSSAMLITQASAHIALPFHIRLAITHRSSRTPHIIVAARAPVEIARFPSTLCAMQDPPRLRSVRERFTAGHVLTSQRFTPSPRGSTRRDAVVRGLTLTAVCEASAELSGPHPGGGHLRCRRSPCGPGPVTRCVHPTLATVQCSTGGTLVHDEHPHTPITTEAPPQKGTRRRKP